MISKAVQDYYPDHFAHCFGCGRLNAHGHHFRTQWDGAETLTEFTPLPEHTAIPGFVYGGLIASLIDCHSTGSAALALYRHAGHELGDSEPVPRCVTAALTVNYLRPTPLGPTLRVRGRIESVSARKAVITSQLWVLDTITVESRVVAVAVPDTFGQLS
ncbi:MAG: PaaI family thioesterase [Firmicutes bacterium]|nr:PaaI family thioesterase [Bacillota bacterium]